MNIRCIIIDDEPLALKKLKRYILKYPFLELVSSCHNVETARRALESSEVNLIFIDINMPDVNGLEFIRSLENPPIVVFVTAYPEYAVESYRVNALDYLLKPFGTEEFNRVAEKVYNHWQLLQNHSNASATGEDNVRYLKCDHRFIRVECDDIRYIEGQSEYLKIHLVSDNPFLTHMTFRQITDSFPDNFIQIHRSYVVNMKHVVSAERTIVILDDGTRLPVSSSRRNDLLKYMNA
ncbi:MAG: response regulator transcription factor [Bacteroidales bacterium]|nr:response regulator transcription factor [Bacteroidales bacterium]